MPTQVITLIVVGAIMFLVIGGLAFLSHYYTLDGIKSKTVGDGQHGTARWATKQEIRQTYAHVPFEPELWRKGEHLPEKQGLVLGCEGPKDHVTALVDTDDIHAMVTAASGAGKTAFFLYPNIEYALASGMSFLCTDTKGDLFRNYAGIAKDCYGYQIAVLDLRNPTRSDGNNLLHLINKYMDIYKADPKNLAAKAKAEKYSKILAKTLINTSGGDSAQYGQNAFFYDSAEGLLTAMFLLVAEYLPTEDADGNPIEKRHIVSVFKLVQELLAPSRVKGKNQFQLLLEKLPPNHKARWFAGSALNTAEQAMASVISTVLSRLNAFLDSEMEQILCFDTAIDAEKFCNEKSAIFIVLPEEDQTKYFMVSLILQNLYREILTVADENGGRLKNRVVFFADELGTCPPIQSLELMFSASRSRGLMLVPIVQSIITVIMSIASVVVPAVLAGISALAQGIGPILEGIKTVFDGLIAFITGVFTGNWSQAWEGVKQIFGGAFGALVGLLKTPVNAVIALINKAISGINGLGLDIPDWVPIIGGKSFHISIPEIPMLEKGGFTDGVSIAGEAGREAVISFQRGVRAQNIATWAQAGRMLGVSAEQALSAADGAELKPIDPGEGGGGGGSFTFAPNIVIQGNADADVLEEALRRAKEEFEAWYEQMMRKRARTAY